MKTSGKIRVLIADDHFIVRMGLASVVNMEQDMVVVGEAADGGEAVEKYSRLKPDLVLLDVRMPVKDGIQVSAEIRQMFPEARVLMLSTYDGDEEIHQALQSGAQGYVLKNSTKEMLIPALRAVAAGKQWIPTEIATRLATRKTFGEITPRELEVLTEIAKGLANKEIADALKISEYTVKDHLKSILEKLRAADRTEAVTTAIQRGLIHV